MLNISRLPYSMLGCTNVTEQLRAQTLMFCSTLGQREGGKKRGKIRNLPNTFDNDCRLKLIGSTFHWLGRYMQLKD